MTNKAKCRRAIVTAVEGVIVAAVTIGGMAIIGFLVEAICQMWGC